MFIEFVDSSEGCFEDVPEEIPVVCGGGGWVRREGGGEIREGEEVKAESGSACKDGTILLY
jgi:hypothetical protein